MRRKEFLRTVFLVLAFVVGLGKDVIESQIDGAFSGFKYGNEYKLMNGQVWVQVDQTYNCNDVYVPRVVIFERNGYFYMKLDCMDEIVAVQQVR